MKEHFTIKEETEIEYIINKSKFIAHIKHIESPKDADEIIYSIRKKHYTARHNCFAYILGENSEIQKASDDGEPSGTAGVPILEVLKKKKLTNVIIVVTRYFGGIKLGAGGLIRAYSHSASLAVENSILINKKIVNKIPISISYDLWNTIENFFITKKILYDNVEFTDIIKLDILLDIKDEKTIDELNNLTAGRIKFENFTNIFYEIPIK